MPAKLRRRIYCHYCGERSQFQLPHKEGRKFRCEHCEAVNFLDENGDIADVPPEETQSPRQFAQPSNPTRSTEPSQDSIFCTTCLKNQALFTEALAQYFPEAGDPTEARYDASFSKFKKELEGRYPQCCAICEPRVRQQLQRATYAAKSDHIRRMLERSRQRRIANGWGWRSLVVRLGGLCYCISILTQLAWHASNALRSDSIRTDASNISRPLWRCLFDRQFTQSCLRNIDQLTGPALLLGLLSMWWNPVWQQKLKGVEGRLRGLEDYYILQFVLLAIRFGSWILLQGVVAGRIVLSLQRPLHSICLVLESIIALWSMTSIIRIDTLPPLNWQQDLAPLLSSQQFVPPTKPDGQLFSPPNSQTQPSQPSQPFLIGSLSSVSVNQQQVWRPPTPPEDDSDRMDLDYVAPTFQPLQRPSPVVAQQPQPSPFYGALPSISKNRRLLPRSEAERAPKKAMGIPPGFFDRPRQISTQSQSQTRGPLFADPTLFPKNDRVDTGLESIFGTVFSLREEPIEVRDVSMQDIQTSGRGVFDLVPSNPLHRPAPPQSSWSFSNIFALITTSGLILSASFLLFAEYVSHPFSTIKLAINTFGACIPIIHILSGFQKPSWRTSECVPPLLLSCTLAALGCCKSQFHIMGEQTYSKILTAFLALMIYPEAYLAFRDDNEMTKGSEQKTLEQHPRHEVEEREPLPPSLLHISPSITHSWAQTSSSLSQNDSLVMTRPRANSFESETSEASAATTSSTASGWKTPKAGNARFFAQPQTPGYAGGFSRLALDDVPVGRSVAGPRRGQFGGRPR